MRRGGATIRLPRRLMRAAPFLLLIVSGATALTCYVTDKEGKLEVESDDEWEVCSMVPRVMGQTFSATGLGPSNDDMKKIHSMLTSEFGYSVPSACIMERYDLQLVLRKLAGPEWLFRCFCRENLCNGIPDLDDFLQRYKKLFPKKFLQ